MKIEALLERRHQLRSLPVPEIDPLKAEGSLDEAQLLAFRLDAVRSRAALILDLRGSLYVTQGNTGILVVDGVKELVWSGQPLGERTAWTIVSSKPRLGAGRWSLELGLVPDAGLRIVGVGARFIEGDVPGCDDPPPDYVSASEEELVAGVQGWHSSLLPITATSIDSEA